MKHKRWIALLLVAVLAAGAMSVTAFAANAEEPAAEASAENAAAKTCRGRHGHKTRTAEPENAIGKDAAKEIALADAGVKAEDVGKVKARVTQLEDGTVVYRVSFTAGDLWYCCKVNALTGEILDKTTQDAAEHEAAKAERRERGDKAAKTTEDGAESAGRGHRHGGKHGARPSGTEHSATEAEKSGRRQSPGSKTQEPTAEEGSAA